jgi:hypothetical protein
MSNCDLVAARSLIDLAASRLALRTPALRAALSKLPLPAADHVIAFCTQIHKLSVRNPRDGRNRN